MATCIHKYEIEVHKGVQKIMLPEGAEVVHAACQYSITKMQFWAKVNPHAELQERAFLVVGTGHDFPEHAEHRGSTILEGGHLVWHLMELV